MKYLYLSLALLGLVGTAFFLGRSTAPKPKPPDPIVVTRTVELPGKTVTIEKEGPTKVVTRTVKVQVDGTREETNREETKGESISTTTADKKDTRQPVVSVANPDEEALKVGYPLADWKVSVLTGADLDDLWDGPIFGAQVEYRVVGPCRLGVFALTNGTVGVSLSGEW